MLKYFMCKNMCVRDKMPKYRQNDNDNEQKTTVTENTGTLH